MRMAKERGTALLEMTILLSICVIFLAFIVDVSMAFEENARMLGAAVAGARSAARYEGSDSVDLTNLALNGAKCYLDPRYTSTEGCTASGYLVNVRTVDLGIAGTNSPSAVRVFVQKTGRQPLYFRAIDYFRLCTVAVFRRENPGRPDETIAHDPC
jgi:Flp pilus assembly protein TadG